MKGSKNIAAFVSAAFCLLPLSGVSRPETAHELVFDLEGISEISVSYDEEEVTLFESGSGDLVIREYMTVNNRRCYAKVSRTGRSVRVSEGGRPLFDRDFHRYVEVYLPAGYSGNLTLVTTSGNISTAVKNLSVGSLRVHSTSGTVRFGSVSALGMYLSTTNGSIECAGLSGGSVFLETTSGRIAVQSADCPAYSFTARTANGTFSFGTVTAGSIGIETKNGTVKCAGLNGAVSYVTTGGSMDVQSASGCGKYRAENSGFLNVAYTEVTADLFFFSKNGSISLTLPDSLDFEFRALYGNGTVSVPFREQLTENGNTLRGSVGSRPAVTVCLETKNGNIRVKR